MEGLPKNVALFAIIVKEKMGKIHWGAKAAFLFQEIGSKTAEQFSKTLPDAELEEGINEGGESASFCYDDQKTEKHQDDNDGYEPPFLVLSKKLKVFCYDSDLCHVTSP
jgi:hypothetical protein